MANTSHWDVIVVDDEKDNIGVVELVLQFNNARVRSAASGQECLKLLDETPPTFLLIDIQMPEMSGYQLLEMIHQNPAWQGIPSIALTAHARSEDRQQILAAGFDGYISKPISVMSLIDDITQILNTRG
jgi:CheY-like chemotaxis protein